MESKMELLDQRQQIKLVHTPDGMGPPEFPVPGPGVGVGDKGGMEMGGGDDIPGVTGQGAHAEIMLVVDKMGDDDFGDLQGKPGGGE